MVTSQELIEGCKKRFDELQEERIEIKEDLIIYLKFLEAQGMLMIKDEETLKDRMKYFFQRTDGYHWKSFYHGWIEGKLYLDGKNK